MPEAQTKKPAGLRTYADDYQRLSGKDDIPLAPNKQATPPPPEEESFADMVDNVRDAATPSTHSVTINDAPATQNDVREVVAAYDTSDDMIEERFDDLDVTLNNEDSEEVTSTRVAEDVAAHTVDVDALLTDANSAAVGVRSQDVSFRDDNGESGNANIIRETKGERFHLFPAIIESIKSWFITKQEDKNAKEAAKPTVINPETRKERLKEAARHSALPKGAQVLVAKDADSVSRDKKAAESDGLLIKDKTEIPTPTWSHVVDEESETKEVPVSKAPDTPTTKASPEAAPTKTATKKAPSTTPDQTTSTPEASDTKNRLKSTPKKPAPAPTTTSSKPAESTDDTTTSPLPETDHTSAPTPTKSPAQSDTSQTIPVNAQYEEETQSKPRFYLTLILAISIAIVLGGSVAYGVYIVTQGNERAGMQAVSSATVFDEQIGLSAVNPFNFLQEASQTIANTENTILHLYPTITTNEGAVTVLSPEALLRPLNTSITDPFLRAIENLTFGSTRTQVPFIVITVNDFDIAFAGMLSWEQSLADDLAPFLGEATTEPFTDVRFANQDLRLSDRIDDELVYTFINKRIIIITTDRNALQDINTLLQ